MCTELSKEVSTPICRRHAVWLTVLGVVASMPATAASRAEILTTIERINQIYDEFPVTRPSAAALPFSAAPDTAMTQNNPPRVAHPPQTQRFAIGEELIYTVKTNDLLLGDILAINSKTGIKVGLGEFFQLIDFMINVEPDLVRAEGWFLQPDNPFRLSRDGDELLVNVSNRTFSVAAPDYLLGDDLYVELTILAQWFNIDYTLDEAQLELHLQASRPLPIEQRLQRQKRRVERSSTSSLPTYPVQEVDYQLFSVPLLDAQVSLRTTDTDTSSAYSLLSSQDLGYFSSQLFLYGTDDDALVDARLTLSRRSAKADLLGPLAMTEYAFGDVTPVSIGVGDTLALGRGFRMSNAPLGLTDNRQVNLVGEIQPGWDIELYRNGVLIDNLTNVAEGRYEFNDVELNYGENKFELVFYGPQGQIERRSESYFVDTNVIQAGEGLVQFSAVDKNRSLLGVGDFTDAPENLGPLLSATYDYGVTDWLSVGLGASYFAPEQGQQQQQFALRTALVLGSFGLLNSIYQVDDDQRRSMLQSYRTRFWDIAWDLSYRKDDILSPETATRLSNSNDTFSVRMTGTLFPQSALPVNYQNSWRKAKFESGTAREQFVNSLGIHSRWGTFSHDLIYQSHPALIENEASQTSEWRVDGTVGYRTRVGRMFSRWFADYRVRPASELTAVGAALTYPFDDQLNGELRYAYDVSEHRSRYDMRINWFGDALSLSAIANYAQSDDWSINLVARFGLGYDATTDTLFYSGRSLSQGGAVVIRAFEDTNADNIYNKGEPLLEDVSVEAVQAFRQDTTDQRGIAILRGLADTRSSDIQLDEETLPHPSMRVSTEGFAITARRGQVQQFDIPVVKAGELEGTLYLREESGDEIVAPYVRLDLLDEQGRIVARTRSEFDGYYLFDAIPPGDYRLQVDTKTGRVRGMTPLREKHIRVSNQGDLLSNVEVILRELRSADGYVAMIEGFHSLSMLKVYLSILRRRLDHPLLNDAFYLYDAETEQYFLSLDYAEQQTPASQEQIEATCKLLRQLDLRCQAYPVAFKY